MIIRQLPRLNLPVIGYRRVQPTDEDGNKIEWEQGLRPDMD
jgi:hypothetical protein